jgi:hypothetical protein
MLLLVKRGGRGKPMAVVSLDRWLVLMNECKKAAINNKKVQKRGSEVEEGAAVEC